MSGVFRLLLATLLALASVVPAAAEEQPAARAGFGYGTILNSLPDAALAHAGGFTTMSAFVAWSALEPTRGLYRFEQLDEWGRTAPNDLTNVIEAARANGMKVGLRLDAPPDWAGAVVYRLDPA